MSKKLIIVGSGNAALCAGISALEGPQDEVDSMVTAFHQRREVIVNGLNRSP